MSATNGARWRASSWAGGVKDNLQSRYVAAAFDPLPLRRRPKVYTYAAREEDIRRVMQMYADAARRAIDAGFDILYIHGAAGVFPAHALSRHFNRRKDGYGGSFENRARFWIEALRPSARWPTGNARSRPASPSTISPAPGAWKSMTRACASSSW
jgi:NADH:flavin oxidoreductases, Old Yellow Enzyme family